MFLLSRATGPPAMAEPTSLLTLVAGEFAPRLAALWPAPHAAYVTASAARRHLACLALTLGRDHACRAAIESRMARAMAEAVGDPPLGLARALTRMGDVAWAAADYRTLLRLLADPIGGRTLRHAEVIESAVLRRLEALPPPMAGAAHLACALSDDGAMVLREAYDALRLRDGLAAADAAAARWAQTQFATTLFDAARHDLAPELPPPPHRGTERLRPLATRREMRDAARRFRNCLADHVPHAATGSSAYYEWVEDPGAVVRIDRDHVFGWRLEEVRAARNFAVPEATQEGIAYDLDRMGVHIGRSGWELHRVLTPEVGVAYRVRTAADAAAEAFEA